MKLPRPALAGLLLVLFALLAASCGTIANPQGWAAPVLDGSTTYIFQKKDRLAALDTAADGRTTVRWTFPDKTRPNQKDIKIDAVYGTPVLDGDRLYFASYAGELFAVGTKDGELIWRTHALSGSIVGGVVIDGDRLYVATTAGRFYALTKSDGKFAPGWPTGGLPSAEGIWAPPIIANGVAYLATMAGDIRAVTLADQSAAWPAPYRTPGAIASLALLGTDRLFVPGLNKTVTILDTKTGQPASPPFHASEWVWTEPAFRDGTAYFGDFAGKVYALDITTGTVRWTADAQHPVKAAPALLDDVLVVVDRQPIVHLFDARTGAPLAAFPLLDSGTVRAPVVAAGSVAYIVTTGGKLYRVDGKARSVAEVTISTGGGQ